MSGATNQLSTDQAPPCDVYTSSWSQYCGGPVQGGRGDRAAVCRHGTGQKPLWSCKSHILLLELNHCSKLIPVLNRSGSVCLT